MEDFVRNLNELALENKFFRQVLETGEAMQVVVMSLEPGQDIGAEVHENTEQVLICMYGQGQAIIDDYQHDFNTGDMMLVKAGREHNFVNTGQDEMKIVTIYSPPQHQDGIVHETKADAESDEAGI
jgi:mannose-6-phosphate isomerase-like protein (cupin superfamily)